MENTSRVYKIFATLKKSIKNPRTELIYSSNFELLISVILSAQAKDTVVNLATSKLFKVANTPKKLLKIGEEELKIYLKNIGLFNSKTKNILSTCKILIEKYNSKVPKNRSDLEDLPGIGRKSASVILNTLVGEHCIAVDTHVFRVSRRLGIVRGTTVLEVEKELMKKIPKEFVKCASNLLVLHGRYVCKARCPLCSSCVVKNFCKSQEYFKQELLENLRD